MKKHLRRHARTVLTAAGVCLVSTAGIARADPVRNEVEELRATLRDEITAVRQLRQQLNQEVLRLDQKSQLVDRQLQSLRAAGPGRPAAASAHADAPPPASAHADAPPPASAHADAPPPASAHADAPPPARSAPVARAQLQDSMSVAQQSDPPPGATPQQGDAGSAPPTGSQSAPIDGPPPQEQQARRALQTALPLSATGGVLTPSGQVQVSPSIGFDYTSQNQLGVNGFQIIPGITFGNIFVNRVEQNVVTAGATVRVGITDRLELNARIPYVYNSTNTTSLIPVGANAQELSTSASNLAIGDIQFGASYQINAGQDGWPIFIANAMFKTATGVSPYEVPIITINDPNGQFLAGIAKKSPTGTGFYSISPSLTVIYPTAPGTLFANLLYTNNLGRRVSLQSTDGGPPLPINLTPGQSIGLTLGIGFALNDRASLSLSYQQQHVFSSQQDGHDIAGSSYSFGSFNFGIGYELSERMRVNANIGIGVGPNTPAARVLIEVPYRFSL